MKRTKILLTILIISILIISQTACGREEAPVSKTSYYLDTICQIDIYGIEEEEANKLIDGAFEVIRDAEKLLSKTIEGSDVDKINKNGSAEVDDMTVDVIKKGIYYGELSDGKFDITVGRLSDLWDFHSENPKVPEKKDIAEAIKHIDYRNIFIDGNTVTLKDPEAEIDLGGIAKGYICDQVTDYLTDKGVESAIVNLGGNIAAIGEKADNIPFKVGIEKPFSDRSEIVGYVESSNQTFVTSGIYERFFEENGKTYHHILNVDTGYPTDADIQSVTIISKLGCSTDCDGLSTTCLMLGVKDARKLIDSIDSTEAVFVDKDGNITATDGAGFVEE